MNDEKARIRLAEAMGWRCREHDFGPRTWSMPGEPEAFCFLTSELPDPFHDANDDYAALEWAINNLDFDQYFAALTKIVGSYCYMHEYRIGYYARAALEVI